MVVETITDFIVDAPYKGKKTFRRQLQVAVEQKFVFCRAMFFFEEASTSPFTHFQCYIKIKLAEVVIAQNKKFIYSRIT